MRSIVLNVGATIAVLLTTTGAWGQANGEATLSIGEVDSVFTLNAEQSDWSGSASFPSVSILLGAGEAAREEGVFGLRLGFEMMDGQVRAAEARLLRRSGDATESLYCKDETESGDLLVEVETVAQDGDALSIQGRLSCQLGTSENSGRDIDLSNPLPISGYFDLTLERL